MSARTGLGVLISLRLWAENGSSVCEHTHGLRVPTGVYTLKRLSTTSNGKITGNIEI